MCAVFAGGSLRRLQLPGDRGGAGHHQQGLHQDVLQSDQAPALAGPDCVRGPPAHRPGSAQRHRDGGEEPLGNSLCPQVCDEVHVLTKNLLPKKSKLIFKQQFLVDNQSINLTLFLLSSTRIFSLFSKPLVNSAVISLSVYQYQYYTFYTTPSYSQILPCENQILRETFYVKT